MTSCWNAPVYAAIFKIEQFAILQEAFMRSMDRVTLKVVLPSTVYEKYHRPWAAKMAQDSLAGGWVWLTKCPV